MKKLITFLPLMLIWVFSWAQLNPKIDKEALFNKEEGMKEAQKSLKTAEMYFKKGVGTYDEALKHYLKVYAYNPNSKELNFTIGVCHLWTNNKKGGLKYFLESSPEVSGFYYLGLGRSYQYNLDYANAKDAYQKYLASLKKWKAADQRPLINQLIAECDNGAALMQDSLPAFIINLGPLINSYYDDYGAYLSDFDSIIYFTSKRPAVEPRKRESRFKYNERLLIADNGVYRPCQWVEDIKATRAPVNVGIAGIDQSEKRLYLYKGKFFNGGIETMVNQKGKWKKRQYVGGKINHIAYKETTISIDNDGNAYFVTDRRGGEGGKDIWVSERIRKQKFGKPKNLGELINTPFDEEGVYITPDGRTLYFSSKGHSGMGGFDVYKSIKSNGKWSKPVNLGHPINSPADELFYHPTSDSLVALYSTMRPQGYGGYDIYKIQIDTRIPFKLIGSVIDSLDKSSIPATVSIYNTKTDKFLKQATVDSLSGIYMIDFEDGGPYKAIVSAEGYKSKTVDLICPKTRFATESKDFELEQLKHPFTLSGKVDDVDNQKPILADLVFKDLATGQFLGRVVSVDTTGAYSITFEDKFDLAIEVNAIDYFMVTDTVMATSDYSGLMTKNIHLLRSKIDYVLTGRITESEASTPIYAAMSFYNPGETEPFTIAITDSVTGKYTVTLDKRGPFLIEIEAQNYFFLNDTYQFNEGQTYSAKNFELKKMETGVKIVMDNILFNSGKATLTQSSFAELDKLASLLDKNAKVRIEVSGHTDNVGSASVNKKLSHNRAITVKNYLVSRGIADDRIEAVGYGFEQPIAPNDTPEGRDKNRRVELKVLN